MNKFTSLLLVLLIVIPSFAQTQKGTFAFINAKIETITSGTINNGTLVIRDNKIIDLGTNITLPVGIETLDCKGLSIYPGFIDCGTSVGLVEVGMVDVTNYNN